MYKRPMSSLSESSCTSDQPPSPASLDMDFDDPKLTSAMIEATRTNTMTPIIKQEIRSAIQIKRLKKGKDELVVSLEPKSEREVLSSEDKRKRQLRKERNRVAAQKCRMKRKAKADVLVDESKDLESKNKHLWNTISELEEEKNKLLDMLKCHTPFCLDPPLITADRNLANTFAANPVRKPRLDSIGTCSSTSFDTEGPLSPDLDDSESSDDTCSRNGSVTTGDQYIPQGNLFETIDAGDLALNW
ncbi:protein c-Fos-like [Lineus longissimus]|uniref:protein c-Fos-like n=1 Tax=Lineus longissimus TaxID=88925 RepID=UPI002B4D5B6E